MSECCHSMALIHFTRACSVDERLQLGSFQPNDKIIKEVLLPKMDGPDTLIVSFGYMHEVYVPEFDERCVLIFPPEKLAESDRRFQMLSLKLGRDFDVCFCHCLQSGYYLD